ncbi:MAG: YbaB/EbfC family nucleoid-associated protein [bacterium]
MFDKLKQLSQLKQMQDELGKESLVVNSSQYGEKLNLTITGKQEILAVHIDPELLSNIDNLQTAVKDLINQAIKESHQIMMRKMQSGNFNLPQM